MCALQHNREAVIENNLRKAAGWGKIYISSIFVTPGKVLHWSLSFSFSVMINGIIIVALHKRHCEFPLLLLAWTCCLHTNAGLYIWTGAWGSEHPVFVWTLLVPVVLKHLNHLSYFPSERLWRSRVVLTGCFVPTGLFPETHYPRLLQTVSHVSFIQPTFHLMRNNVGTVKHNVKKLRERSWGCLLCWSCLQSSWKTPVFWLQFWHVSQTTWSSKEGKQSRFSSTALICTRM